MAEAQDQGTALMLAEVSRAVYHIRRSHWWGMGHYDREQLHNTPETSGRCYVSHKDPHTYVLAPTEWGRVRIANTNYNSIAQAYTVEKAKFTGQHNLIPRLMSIAHPQQCQAISSKVDKASRTEWKEDYVNGAVPTMIRIVKAKFNQSEPFQMWLSWSEIYFVYLSKEKFWGGGRDKQELEGLDCNLFPGQNWYSRILTLIGLVAKNVSIKTLMSVVTIGYSHAKDNWEEAKALQVVPLLAMSNFDTDPESNYKTPDDECLRIYLCEILLQIMSMRTDWIILFAAYQCMYCARQQVHIFFNHEHSTRWWNGQVKALNNVVRMMQQYNCW